MPEDKLIVITPESTFENEASLWVQLLDLGVGKIHVRKPFMDTNNLLGLMAEVPSVYRNRIVIHYYPEVTLETGAGGLHLPYKYAVNGRVLLPATFRLSVSTHNWTEAEKALKLCSYCFISPVFNSISKKGYYANPELKTVPEHLKKSRIYALGGIDADNLGEALKIGYYGAAVMGTLWKNPELAVEKVSALLELINEKTISE